MALVATTIAFGQKKEIAAAVKAADAGDNATAAAQIAAAEASIGGKLYTLEPAVQEQYYYAKGLSLLKSGKTAEGASYLAKINDLGKNKIYTGKDANKTKVYYVGKTAADQSGISGLKEETYVPNLNGKLGVVVNPLLQKAGNDAQTAYDAKNYIVAADKFNEVYNLLNAAGQDNKQYLYYSAVSYAQGKSPKAIDAYNNLIDSGYTGVETTYLAKDKKTGKVTSFDKTTWELYKKAGAAGDYTDFKTEVSKNVEQELYETNAALLLDAGRYDESLALIGKGLQKFPGNTKLTELQGTAYYKAGKMDQFTQNLKDQVAKNPTDKNAWYNLGVLTSKDPAKAAEAEGYFKKVLELDPNNIPALQAMFFNVYLGDDKKVTDEAEAARKAKKTDLFNKILDERRARFAKGLPYVEKWYSLEPNNLEVVSLLKGLYQTTRNDAKFQEFKAKEAALKATQK